ncbi:MAG: glycosyltransferase family 39 protein [Bacteroidia bacterium]|nr:glycosyltransferase family 39 protein [Bacteroidia bacterium]
MNLFLARNKYMVLLLLIFIVSEIIVNPSGNFPLNDDWSYAKTVLIFIKEGDIFIGTWCAMTLASHVLWGFLFTKIFGFSFLSLRVSTLVSSLIGLFVLNQLVIKISGNKLFAFAACLVLLFNPLYFNLSNTFMTDVNFNTWMLLGFYFACLFFEQRKPIYFFMVFFMSMVLVLNRQFGLMLPLGFMVACVFSGERRWLNTGLAFVGVLLVFTGFKWYEAYLAQGLPSWSSYKFSGSIKPTDGELLKKVWYFIELRSLPLLLNLLIYVSPLCLLLLKGVSKKFSTKTNVLIALSVITLCVYLFYSVNYPTGNVFNNAGLGPETFSGNMTTHTYLASLEWAFMFAKLVLSSVSGFVLLLYLALFIKERKLRKGLQVNPLVLTIAFYSLGYLALLYLSDSFFDRYFIPLISCSILFLSFLVKEQSGRLTAAIPLLLVFAYVSVFGTKDYFTMNEKRWEAVAYLRNEKQIPLDKINAGFEVCCWNDGIYSWFVEYDKTEKYDYLVQYEPTTSFTLFKEYEFQRYFPYKKDKINIFVRDSIN